LTLIDFYGDVRRISKGLDERHELKYDALLRDQISFLKQEVSEIQANICDIVA
jgi:hypothetical protein